MCPKLAGNQNFNFLQLGGYLTLNQNVSSAIITLGEDNLNIHL